MDAGPKSRGGPRPRAGLIAAKDLAAAVLKIHPGWTIDQVNATSDWVLREIVFHAEKVKKDGNPLAPKVKAPATVRTPKVRAPAPGVTAPAAGGYKAQFWHAWMTVRGLSEEATEAKWQEYLAEKGKAGNGGR